MGNKGFVY